jgi:hypothetical protein
MDALVPTTNCLWIATQAGATVPAARLFGGVLLWVFVCVLLAVPLLIAIRGAARRRAESRARSGRADVQVDAWRESARRLEPGP